MLREILIGALLASIATAVQAERRPRGGSEDPRVKIVNYHPRDIVRVKAHYGFATLIEFAEDERVETIVLGDTIAWQAVPLKAGNGLLIKPIEQNADTNLTVITDKRLYTFDLHAEAALGNTKNLTYRLQFRYPEDGIAELQQTLDTGTTGKPPGKAQLNFRYTFSGARSIVPTAIFDDGVHTYFDFGRRRKIPAIYEVLDKKGNEAVVNHTVDGRYIRVHTVAKQFTLRLGNEVTCIFNDGYRPNLPPEKHSSLQIVLWGGVRSEADSVRTASLQTYRPPVRPRHKPTFSQRLSDEYPVDDRTADSSSPGHSVSYGASVTERSL